MCEVQVSIMPLFRCFKENVMQIFNAILTEKRVMFVGHNQPAADVSNYVLAACALVSPPLYGSVLFGRFPFSYCCTLTICIIMRFTVHVAPDTRLCCRGSSSLAMSFDASYNHCHVCDGCGGCW